MIRTWRWLAVSSCACVLLGCPPKKSGDDAGADGAAASAVPEAAPAPAAANDSDVTKYPDQSNDYNAPLTARMIVHVRTEASNTGGKVVAQLKLGQEADEIADRAGFDLVLFTDPSDPSRKLEGWAPHTAFVAQPIRVLDGGTVVVTDGAAPIPPTPTTDAGPPPAPATGFVCVKQNPANHCPAGFAVSGAVCRIPCSTPSDCSKGPDPKCNAGKCYASNGCAP